MEPVQRRPRGLTVRDVGSLLSTLFHLAVISVGLGAILYVLLIAVFRVIGTS